MRLLVTAWMSAFLVTSPLIASTQCWQCCASLRAESHSLMGMGVTESSRGCCQDHQKSACHQDHMRRLSSGEICRISSGSDCHQCPKCAEYRPDPVNRPASAPEQDAPALVGVSFVDAIEPWPHCSLAQSLTQVLWSRGELPAPPLRVLVCCWLN